MLQRTKRPKNAPPIRFIAFDGEEATDDNDFYGTGLRGSKPYARKNASKLREVVLMDFIADKDLAIPREESSDEEMWADLRAAASHVGASAAFPDETQGTVLDDHTPFVRAGVPSIDLIDFTFDCWHETCDDMSAVSKASLDMSGETVLEFLTMDGEDALHSGGHRHRRGPQRPLAVTDDGKLDLQMALPPSMGGDGSEGTNPEQLFALGYSACFANAMRSSARRDGDESVVEGAEVTAKVDIGAIGQGRFGLAVTLDVKRARAWLRTRPRRWWPRRTSAARTRTPPAATSTSRLNVTGALRIAAAERSTSAVVVGQPDTLIRIAERPRQTVPPAQHVPSACTRAIASGSQATSTWLSTTSLRISAPPSRSSRGEQRRVLAAAVDQVGEPAAAELAQRGVDREPARAARGLRRVLVVVAVIGVDQVGGRDAHRALVRGAVCDDRQPAVVRDVEPLVGVGGPRVRALDARTSARRDGLAAAHSPNAPSTCSHAPASRTGVGDRRRAGRTRRSSRCRPARTRSRGRRGASASGVDRALRVDRDAARRCPCRAR